MQAPPHPENMKRLATLRDSHILDTPKETHYDDITALAAGICDVPIALISLVDDHRQWFKSAKGLAKTETPIRQSVCSHAILSDDVTEIHDTRLDPRTADNDLLHDELDPLLFYAGAPLLASNGLPLGTLCILDRRPRTLNEFQRNALKTLAAQVVKQIEFRKMLENEETLRAEMDHRIKNSLQATSSLIRIYTRAVNDDTARTALEAVQRRIDAMSALHEQLQRSETTSAVDMKPYLEDLTNSLRVSIPDTITLTLECDPISMPYGDATDIGIILSEFIANSIKHGFAGDATGDVLISLTKNLQGDVVLQALDTGAGSNAEPVEQTRVSGIGSQIVAAAASKLGGQLTSEVTPSGARLLLVIQSK